MTPELAAIGAFLITSLFFAVIIGRINYTNDQKDREQRAIIFDLLQAVEDLEQQKSPTYQVRSGAVDPVVRRNRPDIVTRRATTPPGETIPIDVGDIPDWSPE